MEPKRKLIASASTEKESMKDRLSSLPDEVVHHILSFSSPNKPHVLDIQDLTLFSCVSKRCRQLVLSNPMLRFDLFPCYSSTCKDRLKFINSLDRLLAHRGDNKLQVFIISWYLHCSEEGQCFPDDERYRVMTWVHNVLVRCKVETLHIYMEECSIANADNLVALPACIFHAESLRSLMVEFYCKIQVPSFGFSSNLNYLELRSVTIVDEGFFKWISCCCNCIEQLYLDGVCGPKSITIQSSSLKAFRFESSNFSFASSHFSAISHLHISAENLKELFIDWNFDSPREISLNMFTPNLEKIHWVGNLMNNLNLGKFVHLEEAEIRLQPRLDDWNNVSHVLCSLRGAKAIILTEQLVKTSGFNMEFWKLQDPAFFSQLEEFTIELWEGLNGVELARYILEHAQNLEKMVVVHLQKHSDVQRLLTQSKNLSNATVVFKSVPYYIVDP